MSDLQWWTSLLGCNELRGEARRRQRSQLYSRAQPSSCLQFVAQPSSWLIDIINRSKAKARPSVGYPLGFAGNVLVSRWTQPVVRLIETANRQDSKCIAAISTLQNRHAMHSWRADNCDFIRSHCGRCVGLHGQFIAKPYGIHFRLMRLSNEFRTRLCSARLFQ